MSQTDLERRMSERGVSKTVYSIFYPETRRVMAKVFGDPKLLDAHEGAYTKRQDTMHEPFFRAFEAWSEPVLDFDGGEFPEQYPASGSSEAIREMIAKQGSTQRSEGVEPSIHIFKGEYEGYKAYAEAHKIRVVKHERDAFDRTLKQEFSPGDRFYISQPSGIDGNIWEGYDEFMRWSLSEIPDLKVMLDLAYLGTVPHQKSRINARYENIGAVFFSTSKSFGTYYDRVGGMFSREPVSGLWGNRWFKSLPALRLGTEFMRRYKPGELPEKYLPLRQQVLKNLREKFGETVEGSDVFMIATQSKGAEDGELKRGLYREDLIRYCLTEGIDKAIKEAAEKAAAEENKRKYTQDNDKFYK